VRLGEEVVVELELGGIREEEGEGESVPKE